MKKMRQEFGDDFGQVELVRSTKARRINVRIFPESLRISLPINTTEEEAFLFVDSVRERILKKQKALRNRVQNSKLFLNEETKLVTQTFSVELERSERADIFFSLKEGVLRIQFPKALNCQEKLSQERFWKGIEYFLKKEGKKILPPRVQALAEAHNFSFSSVKIQSSKSRWGSCSQAKSINLSCYLLLLPRHLSDYVILHELCHTKEMNHGPLFWQWMDRVTNNSSLSLRTELKQNYTIPK